MKLTNEQAKELQEKLAAEKNPAEAAKIAKEYGIDLSAEDVEQILGKVGGVRALSDDAIEKVSGGTYGQLDLTDLQYTVIRESYEEGGPNRAFTACILMIPSPICWDIVHAIEHEMGIYV